MITTNCDGGSRGNPGKAAIGIIIRKDKNIIKEHKEKIGIATNNIAEYKAIIKTLELVKQIETNEKNAKEIMCFLDSELIVKQLQGKYKVKDIKLKLLYDKVKELEKGFSKITYKHVSRLDENQQLADKLVNEALDEA